MKRADTCRRRLFAACTAAFLLPACGAALLLAGCDPAEPSAAERTDRASRHYAAAMAELQAGHVEAAIKGFKEVVRAEPGNGNAHFQLAALLEDAKKDYLGAIVHYRLYLTIRPQSDKATVAQDRMKGCETRYAAQLIEKAGVENQFAAELDKLRKEHEQCGKKAAKLSEELDGANRKIAGLEKEVAMKVKMLERASAIADDPSAATAPKRSRRPTDAELLEDESEDDRVLSSADIKSLRAMLDEDERTAKPPKSSDVAAVAGDEEPGQPPLAVTNKASAAANPFAKKKDKKAPGRLIPETYTVEEGDTLMRISAKFYGTNHKWREIREANKTIISPDGRVKTGQVIKLP